ncbi:uncharacterized protein LOC120348191 [Styela clava]
MKLIIHPMLMLFAIIATQVNGGLGDVTLRNSSGEITYDSVNASTSWKFPAEYKDNHTLFIFVKSVSMETPAGVCSGWLYLPGYGGTCWEPRTKCLFYQPFGCMLQNTASLTGSKIDDVVCDEYTWFRLSRMPADIRIYSSSNYEKFVQIHYKYLECPIMENKHSTTVTDSSTDQTLSVTANDVTIDNSPQMLNGRSELIAGLVIAMGLLVRSWVVFGVVIIRNRSKATSRNPDVKETEAEKSNTREIVVNAIYGENFDRMGDDSQQTSSGAVYSMVHK